MKSVQVIFIAILVQMTLSASSVLAQNEEPSARNDDVAYRQVLNIYQQGTGTNSILFKGKEFEEYDRHIQGYPFFHDHDWEEGSLVYNDIMYTNISMGYDLVADVLIVYREGLPFPIKLESDNVDWFNLFEHHFVRLGKEDSNSSLPETGFYDLVIDSKIDFLVRRKKVHIEDIDEFEMKVINWFEDQDEYYVVENKTYHQIKSLQALLSVLSDHKKEIKKYLKNNSLVFRRQPEETIMSAIKHYIELS